MVWISLLFPSMRCRILVKWPTNAYHLINCCLWLSEFPLFAFIHCYISSGSRCLCAKMQRITSFASARRTRSPSVATQLPEACATFVKPVRRMPLHKFISRNRIDRRSHELEHLSIVHYNTSPRQSFSMRFDCGACPTANGSRFTSSVSCCAPTCRDVFAWTTAACNRRYLNSVRKLSSYGFRFGETEFNRWNPLSWCFWVSEKRVRRKCSAELAAIKILVRETVESVFWEREKNWNEGVGEFGEWLATAHRMNEWWISLTFGVDGNTHSHHRCRSTEYCLFCSSHMCVLRRLHLNRHQSTR